MTYVGKWEQENSMAESILGLCVDELYYCDTGHKATSIRGSRKNIAAKPTRSKNEEKNIHVLSSHKSKNKRTSKNIIKCEKTERKEIFIFD